MGGGYYHIRLVGGIVVWVFKGFKGSLKESIDYGPTFTLGFIIILVIAFLCFYFL